MSDAAVTFRTVATRPFPDQKPGTSGLRKQTAIFKQDHYLANFVQVRRTPCEWHVRRPI